MSTYLDWLGLNKNWSGYWRKGDAQNEGGIDIPAPMGTPIYAIADGDLVGAGDFYHSDGTYGRWVVTERVTNGLGTNDLYYQHIDIAPGIQRCDNGHCGGQQIHRGQLIGYAHNPPGEVEVGINPPWAGIWGPLPHPGAWVDPENYIRSVAGQGGQVDPCYGCGPQGSDAYNKCHAALAAKVGSVPPCANAGIAANSPVSRPAIQSDISGWLNQNLGSIGVKIGLFVLALALVLIGGFILINPDPAAAIRSAVPV